MIDMWRWVTYNIRHPATKYMTNQARSFDETDYTWELSRDMLELFDEQY